MPKKSKTEQTNVVAPAEPVTDTAVSAEPTAEPKKTAAKKASKKAVSSKTSAKKASAKKPAKRSTAKTKPVAKTRAEPSEEDIRIRAYFIAERRAQLSLEGDPNNDWIQAREELLAEFGSRNGNGNGAH